MSALVFPVSPQDGDLWPAGAGEAGKIQWKYNSASGTWNIVPSEVSLGNQESFNDYVFPSTDGSDEASLATDGAGNLSWAPKQYPAIVDLELTELFDGVEVTFTLREVESQSPFTPSPPSNITVFVGGVPQTYGSSYTISGSEITFSEAPPTGAYFFGFGIVLITP